MLLVTHVTQNSILKTIMLSYHSGSDIVLRVEIDKTKSTFGQIADAIESAGGDVIAIDVIRTQKDITVRDITAQLQDGRAEQLVHSLEALDGVAVLQISDQTFLMHLGGKIEVQPKAPIRNRSDLSEVYTPHVAKICKAIEQDASRAFNLTIKRNTIAVVTDGSAVLGLGNIGAQAALPVMEGKAMLFKQLANVDAFPICLNTQDNEEIIQIVKALEPNFGGINLEDIAAPRCFEIEDRLKAEMDIPVFHDDQHGTAAVLLAGLMNALKIVDKKLENVRVVLCGIGAAGIACTNILLSAGVENIIGVDRNGALSRDQKYVQNSWQQYAERTNPHWEKGDLSTVIRGADVFIGVSGPGVLTVDNIKSMASDSIVFTMANPDPEIKPELALPHVRVLATGRSDFPNQINNVLCFPGLFRGVLDCRASCVTENMKLAAAQAIASVVREDEISESYIVPSVFNHAVAKRVAKAVIRAAVQDGVARRDVAEEGNGD